MAGIAPIEGRPRSGRGVRLLRLWLARYRWLGSLGVLCLGAATVALVGGPEWLTRRPGVRPDATAAIPTWRVERSSNPGARVSSGATIRAGEAVSVALEVVDARTSEVVGLTPAMVIFDSIDSGTGTEPSIEFPDSPKRPSDATTSRRLLPGHRFRPLRAGIVRVVAMPHLSAQSAGTSEPDVFRLVVVEP